MSPMTVAAAFRTSKNTRFDVSTLFGCTDDSPRVTVFAAFSWILGPATEQEAEAMKTGELTEDSSPVPRENSILPPAVENDNFTPPEIRSVDPAVFQNAAERSSQTGEPAASAAIDTKPADDPNAKENWL